MAGPLSRGRVAAPVRAPRPHPDAASPTVNVATSVGSRRGPPRPRRERNTESRWYHDLSHQRLNDLAKDPLIHLLDLFRVDFDP